METNKEPNWDEYIAAERKRLSEGKTTEYFPPIKIPENGTPIEVTFREPKPREIKYKNKAQQDCIGLVIGVTHNGLPYTLWLSADTMKIGIARLSIRNNDNLLNVSAIISKRTYEHEIYGETIAYQVYPKEQQ